MAAKPHSAPAAAPPANTAPATPPAPVAAAPVSRFKISTDIPLPTKRVGVKGTSLYPFDEIGIGHSFFVPSSDTMKEPWKTLTSLASRTSRDLHPKAFTTARDTEDGTEGVRIWRTKDKEGPLAPPRATNRKPKDGGAAGTTVVGTPEQPAEAPPPPPPAG